MEVEIPSENTRKIIKFFEEVKRGVNTFINSSNPKKEMLKIRENIDILLEFKSKILGSGAQGIVFLINAGDIQVVLKENLCDEINSLNASDCRKLEHGTIYNTPYLNGRIITLPSSISENIIGYILNNSPNFTENYGVVWQGKKTYSFSERLQSDFFDKIQTGNELLIMIIQYLHAITVAQQQYQFNHNDSHLQNILYKNIEHDVLMDTIHINVCNDPINIDNITHHVFNIQNVGWNIKINDYGLSRIRYKDTVYNPGKLFLSNENKFSHCIDYLTLFGCLFYRNFDHPSNDFMRLIYRMRRLINGDPVLKKLAGSVSVSEFFFDLVSSTRLDLDRLYKHSYRPDNSFIYSNPQLFATPDRVLINLLNILIINKSPIVLTGAEKDLQKNYRVKYSNYPFSKIYPERNLILNDILSYNLITKVPAFLSEKANYNVADNIQTCKLDQYIHVVRINTNKNRGQYHFISECCGLDITEFFEKKNRYGVAINGSFFKINDDNIPIGEYKQKHFVTEVPIPQEYVKYYGLIGISKTSIYIEPFPFTDGKEKYEYISMSGPILIDRRQNPPFVFSEGDMNSLFFCTRPPGSGYLEKMIPKNNRYVTCEKGVQVERKTNIETFNCDRIRAGELSHGSNLNPRSVLAINYKTGMIYFITIEGRNKRGSGQDFLKMVFTLNMIDPEITIAINLDGGGSSAMAWRTIDMPKTIVSCNPEKTVPYLTGNIIGFVTE